MPELPEVEHARRQLDAWLTGKTIATAHAPASRLLRPHSPAALVKAIAGKKVRAVERRGKWLRIVLGDGTTLHSHLGMTGKWVQRAAKEPAEKAEKLRLDLAGRHPTVRLLDARMFGRLLVMGPGREGDAEPDHLRGLGPDPIADGIDPAYLVRELAGSRRSIKERLLDQRLLAGIGNIQATEALWRAKLDPRRRAGDLTPGELRALASGLRWTLDRTLASQANEEIVYLGERAAKNPFKVYGRAGEPCPRCRHPLTRIIQGGRSTTFCPNCQL
jgi:formamidopyrimidine-DNA glycosylase